MLIQEHRFRPITGRVLTLGPQTVPMKRKEVDSLFTKKERLKPPSIEIPKTPKQDQAPIEYFFSKFPIERLESIGFDNADGGSILHDLNQPVPDSLLGQYDFILDGGTFDHLVNIGTALTTVVKLLKPGGRIFQYNAASNYIGTAYISFGPDMFYDFYVQNGFADCKVYLARECSDHVNGPWDIFYLRQGRTKDLNCGKKQMVIVLAEKGDKSTWDKVPVEHAYRPPAMQVEFKKFQAEVLKSTRPPLVGETEGRAGYEEKLRFMKREVVDFRKVVKSGDFRFSNIKESWAGFNKRRKKRTTYDYVGKI
jgi:hypothetical protein